MPISTHKNKYQTRAYLYGYALVVLCLAVFLTACSKGNNDVLRQIGHVKRLMYSHPDSAMTLICQMPDSLLSSQLQQIHNTTTEQLGRGKQWMDLLEQGKTMKNISIEEEQYFIDYYAFSHPEEYKRITSPYRQLSLRHTTYLILSEMGYNDKDIMRILMVKSSTIRNYRLRMNKNKWE